MLIKSEFKDPNIELIWNHHHLILPNDRTLGLFDFGKKLLNLVKPIDMFGIGIFGIINLCLHDYYDVVISKFCKPDTRIS